MADKLSGKKTYYYNKKSVLDKSQIIKEEKI